jgi:hypothetical protein
MKLIECECGCGEMIPSHDKNNRPLRFKQYHYPRTPEYKAAVSARNRGRKITPEHREKLTAAIRKMNKTRTADQNPGWKGDDVSVGGVHSWLRKHGPRKKNVCVRCGKKCKTDWANLDGKYRRDADDYVELCKTCHILFDRIRLFCGWCHENMCSQMTGGRR